MITEVRVFGTRAALLDAIWSFTTENEEHPIYEMLNFLMIARVHGRDEHAVRATNAYTFAYDNSLSATLVGCPHHEDSRWFDLPGQTTVAYVHVPGFEAADVAA
jgi:hypothetical protein